MELFKTVYDTTIYVCGNTSKFDPKNQVSSLFSGYLVQAGCKLVIGPTLKHSFSKSMNL